MARSNEEAEDILRDVLGPLTVLHVEDNMEDDGVTDGIGPDEWDEAMAMPPATVGGTSNPHNHRLTVSMDLRGPHIVVRGETADDIAEGWQELEARGVTAIMASIWAQMNAEMNSAKGVPQPPAPQAQANVAPQGIHQWAAQAATQTYPQGPPAVPQGPPPAAWQGGAPASPVPAGWYKLNVPFKAQGSNPGKPGFDALVAQYSFRKGDPNQGGQVSFQRDTKSWYCAPDIVGAFGQFQPVPA